MSRRRSAGRRANLQACWPPPSEGPNERCESAAARMVVPPPALPRPAPCAQSAALARGGLQVSREIGRKGERPEESSIHNHRRTPARCGSSAARRETRAKSAASESKGTHRFTLSN
ncbi:unnamed protein product [Prorocentrum cordatum]|uniref:Uncharacterized protein n=1 Tax=Prorocentrum cordatum TaxID=2364126 RepID=A0ABN9U8Y1_9DINO|nr:unnamed protein product [Polarella glacialis]